MIISYLKNKYLLFNYLRSKNLLFKFIYLRYLGKQKTPGHSTGGKLLFAFIYSFFSLFSLVAQSKCKAREI